MTRAIRFAVVIVLLLLAQAESKAQNYQTNPGSNPGQGTAPQQPARASVYGPAVGAAGPARQGPANAQPAYAQQQQQVQPVAAQQPIRQPGPGNAAAPGPGAPGVNNGLNGLNVPKLQVVPPGPLQPEWYPLDPKVQEWVDQVLTFWEKRSDQVKTLECTFQKWEYDPQDIPNVVQQLQVQGKLQQMPFSKFAKGVIKYAAPDKGLFRVEQLQTIDTPQVGEKSTYKALPKENGDHWVCDGKRIFAFDALSKPQQVIERQLPPELQGKALMDGPLPFMFGARAESIKARYWIRPLQAEAKGEYCLEAIPKSRQDAANFKSVQIVLDEEVYLPVKMQIFHADYSPNNPHRSAYMFENRVVNSAKAGVVPAVLNPLNLNLNPWAREFYEVKVPSGWRHVLVDANGSVVPPAGTATRPAPATAPKPQ